MGHYNVETHGRASPMDGMGERIVETHGHASLRVERVCTKKKETHDRASLRYVKPIFIRFYIPAMVGR